VKEKRKEIYEQSPNKGPQHGHRHFIFLNNCVYAKYFTSLFNNKDLA